MNVDFGFSPSATKPYHFVSYSHSCQNQVRQIAAALHNLGDPLWYDGGIDVGSRWDKTLETRIDECSLFLLFFDRSMIERGQSAYVYKEYETLLRDNPDRKHHIIPVFLDEITEEMKKDKFADEISRIEGIRYYEIQDPEKTAFLIHARIRKAIREDIFHWLHLLKAERKRVASDIQTEILPEMKTAAGVVSDHVSLLKRLTGSDGTPGSENAQRILLTGEGGAGKTSVIRYVCAEYAAEDGRSTLLIPIKECEDGIFSWLHHKFDRDMKRITDADTFRTAFLQAVSEKSEEDLLLVFDGINEDTGTETENEIRIILNEAEKSSRVSVLGSSRLKPKEGSFRNFSEYAAQVLSEQKIRAFLGDRMPRRDAAIMSSLSNPQILFMYKEIGADKPDADIREAADVMDRFFRARVERHMSDLDRYVYEYIFPELVCSYDYEMLRKSESYRSNMILTYKVIQDSCDMLIEKFRPFAEMNERIRDEYDALTKDSFAARIMSFFSGLMLGRKTERKIGDVLVWSHENYRDFMIAKGLYQRFVLTDELGTDCFGWTEYMKLLHERKGYDQIRKQEFFYGLMNPGYNRENIRSTEYTEMMADLVDTLAAYNYYWKIIPLADETGQRVHDWLQEEPCFIAAHYANRVGYEVSRSIPLTSEASDQLIADAEKCTYIGEGLLKAALDYLEGLDEMQPDDMILKGKVLSNLGACLNKRFQCTKDESDISMAIEWHGKCLEWRKKLAAENTDPDKIRSSQLDIATVLFNLGSDFYQQGCIADSVRLHCEAIEIRRKYNASAAVRASEIRICGALLKAFDSGTPVHEVQECILSDLKRAGFRCAETFEQTVIRFALEQFRKDIDELKQSFKDQKNMGRMDYIQEDYKKLYDICRLAGIGNEADIAAMNGICRNISDLCRKTSREFVIKEYVCQ